MLLEIACPANQYPTSTVKKISPQIFAHLMNSSKNVSAIVIIESCYSDYTINKPFACSPCMICVSWSVHMISMYDMCKGS